MSEGLGRKRFSSLHSICCLFHIVTAEYKEKQKKLKKKAFATYSGHSHTNITLKY